MGQINLTILKETLVYTQSLTDKKKAVCTLADLLSDTDIVKLAKGSKSSKAFKKHIIKALILRAESKIHARVKDFDAVSILLGCGCVED